MGRLARPSLMRGSVSPVARRFPNLPTHPLCQHRADTPLQSDPPRNDSTSYFRGGTYLLGSAELRFAPRGRGRVGPFAVAGFAAGVSRSNVHEVFPTPATNGARAVFGGGGLLVPLGQRLTAFADVRMLIGAEGSEGIVAVAPVRAGVAWRF